MADPTITAFPKGLVKIQGGHVETTDTLKILLLQNTYAYDETDEFVADLTPAVNEHDGGGYSRGTLGGYGVTLRADGKGAQHDANDVTWSSLAAGTADLRYAVIYKHVTNDADSPVIWCLDFGADKAPTGVDFTIIWPSGGIYESMNGIGPELVTTVDQDSAAAQKVLFVASTTNAQVGDLVLIDHHGAGGGQEFKTVESIQAGVSLTMTVNLAFAHTAAQADPVSCWHT